jgi:hypothetical protein
MGGHYLPDEPKFISAKPLKAKGRRHLLRDNL